MGYTHYWQFKGKVPEGVWAAFEEDARRVVYNTPVQLAGWDGELGSEPYVDSSTVSLNGLSPDDYESFVFINGARGFCKTNRKPYDLVVCALLVVAKRHFGDQLVVTSNGDWRGGDSVEMAWLDAVSFADGALARPHQLPFDR